MAIAEWPTTDFAAQLGADSATPGGGAACSVAAALAAGLAEMAARFAVQHNPANPQFAELVETLGGLRLRALQLADADVRVYAAYRDAAKLDGAPAERCRARAAALDEAAQVPAELAAVAVSIAEAGAQLFEHGNPHLRSDAYAVTVLGAAVTEASWIFVAGNLARTPRDPRIKQSGQFASQAIMAARSVHHHMTNTNGDAP